MDGLRSGGVGRRRCNDPFWASREVRLDVTESNSRNPFSTFSSHPSATSWILSTLIDPVVIPKSGIRTCVDYLNRILDNSGFEGTNSSRFRKL